MTEQLSLHFTSLGLSCVGLCASWTWISVSFLRLGMFSAIILSNKLSVSLSSHSGTNISTLDVVSEVPYTIFINHFFCSDWVISTILALMLLMGSSVSLNPLLILTV